MSHRRLATCLGREDFEPIRLFHGDADDWVAIGPCRAYVQRLKAAGADATLTEFPDAVHAYDAQ